jgi:hypothetical protein
MTFAPGTGAFVGSVIVPLIDPVAVWDQATAQENNAQHNSFLMFAPLLDFPQALTLAE